MFIILPGPQVIWVDQQNELITDDSSGVSLTQLSNQFIWDVNFDNIQNNQSTQTLTKLSENIGNLFITNNSNSITSVL
jgi:hypothetical protein